MLRCVNHIEIFNKTNPYSSMCIWGHLDRFGVGLICYDINLGYWPLKPQIISGILSNIPLNFHYFVQMFDMFKFHHNLGIQLPTVFL